MELMSQLETLKTNFLSLVSHDLKTPIARIQGNAELLLRESPSLDARQRKGLAAIVSTTDQMSEYVETVLDLTRVENGKMQLRQESRDINETIAEVIQEKRLHAQEKGIELETHLDPLFTLRYDVRLMRRVLANLVENAIKYSPENSTITVSSREEGGFVTVAVTDQGIGIEPAEQEKIFGKFYRAAGISQTNIKGTGLGLYLVKYFVELHKGGVTLKSELGKGSTFCVSLPI
jgi:signal transduction histidine kinase